MVVLVVLVKLEMQHSPALTGRTPPLGENPSCITTTKIITTTSFLSALAWSGTTTIRMTTPVATAMPLPVPDPSNREAFKMNRRSDSS